MLLNYHYYYYSILMHVSRHRLLPSCTKIETKLIIILQIQTSATAILKISIANLNGIKNIKLFWLRSWLIHSNLIIRCILRVKVESNFALSLQSNNNDETAVVILYYLPMNLNGKLKRSIASSRRVI